jgi:hypothetical protein
VQLTGNPFTDLAASSSSPQAPVFELNGNTMSTINVGDTYLDLDARIVAPTSDLNLGIVILLDGATATGASIDTTQPGGHNDPLLRHLAHHRTHRQYHAHGHRLPRRAIDNAGRRRRQSLHCECPPTKMLPRQQQ